MAKTITIQNGDCLINTCDQEGMSWENVWNHPQNQELKSKRKNPNILKKGDRLYIPDKQYKEDPAQTEARHSYKVKIKKVKFTVTLLDLGKPRSDEKWI